MTFGILIDLISFVGDHAGGVTPVPIPNTVVKPSEAHGTALATRWESRKLPAFKNKKPRTNVLGFFYVKSDRLSI